VRLRNTIGAINPIIRGWGVFPENERRQVISSMDGWIECGLWLFVAK
jgi:hypothetical protein